MKKDKKFQIVLDNFSGVPFYKQIIKQIKYGIANKKLLSGFQLPTVRQLAVDLTINSNTVSKAYKELEILGYIETQQGTGTFIGNKKIVISEIERQEKIKSLAREIVNKANLYGITIEEIKKALEEVE